MKSEAQESECRQDTLILNPSDEFLSDCSKSYKLLQMIIWFGMKSNVLSQKNTAYQGMRPSREVRPTLTCNFSFNYSCLLGQPLLPELSTSSLIQRYSSSFPKILITIHCIINFHTARLLWRMLEWIVTWKVVKFSQI